MRKRCKGFSLIEAAIVLGVVGLVIGGIWIGAKEVSENLKANKMAELSLSIYYGSIHLFKGFPPYSVHTDVTSALIASGIISGEYVKSASLILTPFGQNGQVAFDSTRLKFYFDVGSSSECIKMIRAIYSNKNIDLPSQIGFYPAAIFPVTYSASDPATYAYSLALSNCPSTTSLAFYYPLPT